VKKKFKDISVQFGAQLKRYLDHFGLIEIDIAYLIGSNSNSIDNIVKGDRGVVLKTVEKIANFFGLSYYEMGNPDFPFPAVSNLPKPTQLAILKRKDLGVPDRDYEFDLAGKLDIVIASDFLQVARTSEAIAKQIEDGGGGQIDAVRITDLLGRSPRNKIVVKVGKQGKQNLYQLEAFAEN